MITNLVVKAIAQMQCLWFHGCRAPLSGRFRAVLPDRWRDVHTIPVWGHWMLAVLSYCSSWFHLSCFGPSGAFIHCHVFTQPLNTLQCTGEIPDWVLRIKINLSARAINDSEWSLAPVWVLLISSAPCWSQKLLAAAFPLLAPLSCPSKRWYSHVFSHLQKLSSW